MEGSMADRILVTGGEGFIGKHVQASLDRAGMEYDTLDIGGNPTWRVDITKPIPPEITGYSRVIHLAGLLGTHELFDDVHAAIDVNIKGTVNVLNVARREGASFTGITMDHVWVNPYETTKLAAERLAQAWSREYDIPVNYMTVYNAYGEYQAHGPRHPQKIIPTFARAAWQQKPIPIWGSGNQVVDLIYAGDIADGLVTNTYKDGGYGMGRSVIEVARIVWEMINPDAPPKIEFFPMRKGEHRPKRDPVAQNPLRPTRMLPKLRETLEWYRDKPEYP